MLKELRCLDDGAPLSEAAPHVFHCACGGTLVSYEAFNATLRQVLEADLPRENTQPVACPSCSTAMSYLRIGWQERWCLWCEGCNFVWLQTLDQALLVEELRSKAQRDAREKDREALGTWGENERRLTQPMGGLRWQMSGDIRKWFQPDFVVGQLSGPAACIAEDLGLDPKDSFVAGVFRVFLAALISLGAP